MNTMQNNQNKQNTIKSIKSFINAKDNIEYRSNTDIVAAIYRQWNPTLLKTYGIISANLLNWKPVYFIKQINLINGTDYIIRNGRHYEIKYFHCTKNDINYASKVCLSFRHCAELNLSVVLIKFVY